MKANYHTHTERCRHAQGTERDYVQEALTAGVSILGFSDHAPFPDHDFGLRMLYEELPAYIAAVDQLTQ
ncbi:MAG: PHP domain-containing protein, partial [Oscillospiraceae bacterium]|nr:PHP domain-containing protein [Oscillospiraceae bacterium]